MNTISSVSHSVQLQFVHCLRVRAVSTLLMPQDLRKYSRVSMVFSSHTSFLLSFYPRVSVSFLLIHNYIVSICRTQKNMLRISYMCEKNFNPMNHPPSNIFLIPFFGTTIKLFM